MDYVPMTIIVGSIILVLLANFVVFILFSYQKKHYRQIQEINSIREKYDKEILKTELEIKEQTMQNISQEIHDNIGQVLSLANLQLTSIELPGNSYATGKIDKSMELISKVITDLRDLSKTLNPENIARAGLKEAVRFDLELMERSGVFTTLFEVAGKEKRLDVSKETIIYRIVQQALNNILKHAKATSIEITLNYSEDHLSVSIKDNGLGFDTAIIEADNSQGAGLRNMIHRAKLIQATIEFKSVRAEGTTVLLHVPML
ncbi:MAG TPA: ATP-binding protein [Flavisolibacter sp.]|nr:ATP-binding protein [Flavisolibacter sp.]